MAEQIQIVLKEKQDEIGKKLSLMPGESFFRMLVNMGYFDMPSCGGLGTCGRCKAKFTKGAPLPTPADRRLLTPDELRKGYRLLCKTKLTGDCEITLPKAKNELFIQSLAPTWATSKLPHGQDMVVVVDLGTTTIVAQKINQESHQVEACYKCINPQRAYGVDVISRLTARTQGEDLKTDVINRLIEGFRVVGAEGIPIYISGNTAMMHLLFDYDLSGLLKAPFVMEETLAGKQKLAEYDVYVTPSLSAFVGGDIYAGMYGLLSVLAPPKTLAKGSSLDENKLQPPFQGVVLMMDLGTNGELVLTAPNGIYATATAAGPAFEGMATAGIWGADLIAIAADLYENGILDQYGTFTEQYEKGYQFGDVFVNQEDIRALQLAKAAIRAGMEELLAKAKLSYCDVEQIYLAGGFGYYVNPTKAAKIGLIPSDMINITQSIGNASLWGTYSMTLPLKNKSQLEDKITKTDVINLAKCDGFNEKYLNYINFPEK